ncbi:ankyrin repeat domain-containing protein 34C-like [Limulus polyphemus]|uniref:Ankyrin repeat domain-containing protein 34C-like n=1 Tax=Limulus polyphemus TaxID=6850 RepID=A0ABM1B2J1_LIMPO|nr:ankyrin repeat domain-containing protein 34C-like [Limulus polyphemus]
MTAFGGPNRTPAQFALFDAIQNRRYRQALLLVEAGVDVNSRNERGETPLICTCTYVEECKNRAKLGQLFLNAGADPNVQDWQGLTALMHASIKGQTDMVLLILENNKTEPGIQDMEGNTALMYAATRGHANVISIFTNTFKHQRRALHLGQKNNQGLTALQLASKNKHDGCVRLLTREAQQFPNSLVGEFPDPKELERAPTPTKKKHKGLKINFFSSVGKDEGRVIIPEEKICFSSSSSKETAEGEKKNPLDINSRVDASPLPDIKRLCSTGSLQSDNSVSQLKPRKDTSLLHTQTKTEDTELIMSSAEELQGVNKTEQSDQDPVKEGEVMTASSNSFSSGLTSDKYSILPLITLRSIGHIDASVSSTTSEPWDWDLSVRSRLTGKYRLDTGSRSLSESRGKLTDSLEGMKEKPFSSSDKLHEVLPKECLSPSPSEDKTSTSSSKVRSSEGISILPPLFPGCKDGVHLPPIRSSLTHYKRGHVVSPATVEHNSIKEEMDQSDIIQTPKSEFTPKGIKT